MITESIKEYYIASVECREVKSFSGTVHTYDGTIIWLGYSEGYVSCRSKSSAHKFKTSEEIVEKALQWNGMPWYYQLKPGTLRIYRIKERYTTERTETEVT